VRTTLNKIREYSPCTEGWEKLLKTLGKTKADDESLEILTILDSNGLDDALWCLQAVDTHKSEMRLFSVWCARQVQHLMTDERSVKALDVAEAYAKGEATEDELKLAAESARSAARSAAESVAWSAAWSAARSAARSVAWSARSAARSEQEKYFRNMLEEIKREEEA
jgi:hypothetical protein